MYFTKNKHCIHNIKLVPRPAAELAALRAELAEMRERKDTAYLERNKVVVGLAAMAMDRGCAVGIAKTAIQGWSKDWHNCVYIDLPTGQVSWHYHDSQASLFVGLPNYSKPWDGHDTEEKYRRVLALRELPESPTLSAAITQRDTLRTLLVEAQKTLAAFRPILFWARQGRCPTEDAERDLPRLDATYARIDAALQPASETGSVRVFTYGKANLVAIAQENKWYVKRHSENEWRTIGWQYLLAEFVATFANERELTPAEVAALLRAHPLPPSPLPRERLRNSNFEG